MCGISASFDLNKLYELIKINNNRGKFSFSLMVYDVANSNIVALYQGFDDFRNAVIEYYKQLNNKNYYYISHSQAPTSTDIGLSKDINRIHPAKYEKSFLYHNGIIKDISLIQLKDNLDIDTNNDNWDTSILLKSLYYRGIKVLNTIDGSFACFLITEHNNIQVFRNNSSILYFDDDLSFSSINYNGKMHELISNEFFQLDFESKSIKSLQSFKNIDDRYVFLEY